MASRSTKMLLVALIYMFVATRAASIPPMTPPNLNAELFLETPTTRMEFVADELGGAARMWAKDPRDGSVYAKEGIEFRVSKIYQRDYDSYPLLAPSSRNKTSLMVGTANCEQILLSWLLPNNATFQVMWMACDKDEVVTTYANPRVAQMRFKSFDNSWHRMDFADSQNKSIYANAFKLSWSCENWPMKGNPPLDIIRIDGTIQTDFILGELSPFEVLSTGVLDPVVQKEGSMTFVTPNFRGTIITPTWGVGDFAVKGERQFDGDYDFDIDAFASLSNAIADGTFSAASKDAVASVLIPLRFRSGETRSFAYYDPDFIVIFTGMTAPEEPGGADPTKVGVAAGVSVGAVVVIGGVAAAVFYVRKSRKDEKNDRDLTRRLDSRETTTAASTNTPSSSTWRASKTNDLELHNASTRDSAM